MKNATNIKMSTEQNFLGEKISNLHRFVFEKLLLNISAAFLILAMCFMVFEASSRSIMSESHWWAEELVRFLVVWAVLLSFGVASDHGHFIRMDLLYGKLNFKFRIALNWINCLCGLTFCGILIYSGFQQVAHLEKIGMTTDSNLNIELWIIRTILPICGILYSFYFIKTACQLTKGHIQDEVEEGDNI